MKRWLALIFLLLCSPELLGGGSPLLASPRSAPQPVEMGYREWEPSSDQISPEAEQAMWEEIQHNIAGLRETGALPPLRTGPAVTYDFPLRLAPGLSDYAGFRVSAFPDHDPGSGQALDYSGGARTYDGHRGTDYALWPFSWNKLDAGEVQVIAAAAGTIAAKADVDPTDHHCGGGSADPWNYVALMHADGRMTIYGHLRYHSLTGKGVGQTVAQGEYLGTVGSSGNSSGPHLHFEVRFGSFSAAEWLDPHAGPYSQPESLWVQQRPYLDSAINKLATHSAPPGAPDPCAPSITNLQDLFTTPVRIYFYAYYRDYQGALTTQLHVYRPDGSLYTSWSYTPGGSPFNAAWSQGWAFDFSAGDPAGTWRFEALYNGQAYETSFRINPHLIARDDLVLTLLDAPVTIDVLGNDEVPQDDPPAITVGLPVSGTASLVHPRIRYTPAPGFLGADTFTYRLGAGTEQAEATVTVLVVSEIFHLFLPVIQR